jgi:short subunit dehydrogenase-like uncharacterized protein
MLALYGATGYTGRLVAAELKRRGLQAILAGRSRERLRALADELEVDWPVRAAQLDDAGALRGALDGARVVINCAGPFTFYGAPVIEAAREVGAHYVDTTGEQLYMQRVFEHEDAPSRRAGVAVVPAVGFDYVPGDLIAALAARGREPLRELVIAYDVKGFGMTRGTLHSGVEMLRGGDLLYEDGAFRLGGRAPERTEVDFPAPIGRLPAMRYPGGEVVTVPRHVTTRRCVEYWSARTFAPHPALAAGVPVVTPFLRALFGTPARSVIDAAIDRLPEGPSPEVRRAARFTILATARGEDGSVGQAVVEGGDLYGLTGVIAVRAAELLADDGFAGRGVLAPAQAFDPAGFLDDLAEHGVRHRSTPAAVAA